MIDEDLLRGFLSVFPRPRLPAFFASRTTARLAAHQAAKRAPLFMWLYWLPLTFFGGMTLLSSWSGIAIVVGVGGIVALADE